MEWLILKKMSSQRNNRDSSSSDSEEDRTQIPERKVAEMHNSKDCKYNKFKQDFGGREIYVWQRNCVCDKSSSWAATGSDRDEHLSGECKWRQKWSKPDQSWALYRKCVCKGSEVASYTGNVSGIR